MDWLSTENTIAVLTAALGLLATVGALWYERRVPRRKRVGYRVQMDTAIGDNIRTGGANTRLGLFDETPEMSDATLVLLRVENDGSQSITDADYTGRALHGLTAVFTGRTIRGLAVTAPTGADHLMEHFTAGAGLRYEGSTLHIPRVPLNRGQHYKLLVLLTGGPVGGEVTMSGGIQAGEVRPNRSTTPDDKPPLFSLPAQLLTVLLTLSVTALASIIVLRDATPPPIECATGELTVLGSTAFAPVAEELADKYEKDCPGSDITVAAHGSAAGIRELDDEGKKTSGGRAGEGRTGGNGTGGDRTGGQGSPPLLAFSDGPKSDGFPRLAESRVAVSVFALVLNDRVRIRNLTRPEVRRLYRGGVRNWKQLGGPDLPVVLVSRGSSSGTRDTLQRRVLGGAFEIKASSNDCLSKDDPSVPVTRCELDSTEQVLDAVGRIPGAIGYSELRSAAGLKGLHRLNLDGHEPSVEELARSGYPYREIEYAYTYGRPPADSLASSFLAYARGTGLDVIRTHGHLPCATPEGLRICGDDA
ncbi:phosphate ABC transporter substrate-binding protein [Streptomyces sp. BG9H]|uniref:Phosphate ABC transporter substrate-binding protein n=1 Tax=Streptomyces anatolicus TaxID=2675858 RepID=A0ABS6YWC7_9ACTN|nr:substrate-binding domain-containing protein [Streptomyces anatolicus]MBW5425370.1 phosphate ABC transporter substrate-binding protein [Streptomyces anatolicus]